MDSDLSFVGWGVPFVRFVFVLEQKGFQNKNKSNKGNTPANKGKIRIHKIPNDPKSPFRYVTEHELSQIYHGVIDEGF